MRSLLLVLPLLLLVVSSSAQNRTYVFVPKLLNLSFFDILFESCQKRANEVGVECLQAGSETDSAQEQAAIIDSLILDNTTDGIIVSVLDENITGAAIDRAVAAGIPVVTVDSDAPNSNRTTFIGTDNFAMGESFAFVLTLLGPNGGMYGVISADAPNLALRVQGLEATLAQNNTGSTSNWISAGDPVDCQEQYSVALDILDAFAKDTTIAAVIRYVRDAVRCRDGCL